MLAEGLEGRIGRQAAETGAVDAGICDDDIDIAVGALNFGGGLCEVGFAGYVGLD